MNLKEILGEELFNQVTTALKGKGKDGKDIDLLINDGSYVPLEKFNDLNEQKKLYKTQADDLNKQLEEMKKNATGNEELTKQIEALQDKVTEAEGKVKDVSLTSAIKLAVIKAQAKDADVVSMLVDKTKLNMKEDGTIEGLEEQIKTLSESKAFLFGEDTLGGRKPNENNTPPSGVTKEQFNKMSYRERVELANKNPELYKKLRE